ncbi:MAG: translational GTPase TypA [Bradymonadia bacterium]
MSAPNLRNIAIIAHVDHGKTTLVDGLLKQSGTVAGHQRMQERAMDRLDLEQERGITILSKNTAIKYRDTLINIVDTPGHSDFGGEVERVLHMVDSVLLLVDAFEGPMPQTRFVLRKALGHGLRPIVVINKVDRPEARPDEVLDMVFDLFGALDATDEQLDFPVIYASAKQGWAVNELEDEREDLTPLFEMILDRVPSPEVDLDGPFQMQVATIGYNDFVGRIAVGRIARGKVLKNTQVAAVDHEGKVRRARISRLNGFVGLEQVEIDEASAGDVVGIAGVVDALPGETFCDPAHIDGLPPIAVDEPTISMDFMANTGPFSGKEGQHVTSRKVRDRLEKELQSNVALRMEQGEEADTFRVSGRGELHLAILLETMRREGYELMVSMPRVIFRDGPDGKREEPYEDVTVDCGEDFSGTVIQELNNRGGEMREMTQAGDGQTRLEYTIPSRGLIGYRGVFLTQTRGTGNLYSTFSGYGPYRGAMQRRASGVMIAQENGKVTSYAMETLQERGVLFVEPGDQVYAGMLVGECARGKDLVVNPCKAKKLDNMRSAFKDVDTRLNAVRKLTLEEALEFINPDEWVEITPKAIRVRKRLLDHNERKRLEKKGE